MSPRAVGRRYVWVKDDPAGMEQATIELGANGMAATSVALGSAPVPYRVDLELETGASWVTRRLALTATGDGWSRALTLRRGDDGRWTADRATSGAVPADVDAGVPADAVDAAEIPADVVDVDVQWCPVTNLMPVRRLGLDRPGATGTFTMAWVSVPSLAVTLDVQRYTVLGLDDCDTCVRFENASGFFVAVIRCDDDGVVRDYPGIARRLGTSSA